MYFAVKQTRFMHLKLGLTVCAKLQKSSLPEYLYQKSRNSSNTLVKNSVLNNKNALMSFFSRVAIIFVKYQFCREKKLELEKDFG